MDFEQWYFHMQSTRAGEARMDARYDCDKAADTSLAPQQRAIYQHECNIDNTWAHRREVAARKNKPL